VLRNAVAWVTNEQPPVTVTGEGMLDVTVWRQKESMTVHLVNLTNAMMMKGPYREFTAAPPQEVRVRLPKGATAKKVRLLVDGAEIPLEEKDGLVSVKVQSILDHEVIAIDL
jgi:hypothetical protein